MRIKELTNAPEWLLDAFTENEDVTIDVSGRVQWNSGDFCSGNFRGDFCGGNFYDGNFWGNFYGGNFCGGDFRGNFYDGNFCGGDFWGEKITNRPLSIYGLCWDIWISDTRMKIGCQLHSHDEWKTFSDEQISKMASKALPFWNENKTALLAMCSMHAAAANAKREKVNV